MSVFYRLLAGVMATAACLGAQTFDIAARLAKWKNVEMPYHAAGLTARERQMVDKLVEANRLLDDVYWRQSDRDGLALYKSTTNPQLRTMLMIMGGRWRSDRSKIIRSPERRPCRPVTKYIRTT